MYFKAKMTGLFVGLFYRFYSFSFRYRFFYLTPENKLNKLATNNKLFKDLAFQTKIYAVWHQDELALLPYFANRSVNVMVSLSKDGTMFAWALKIFGFKTIRGSSHRGGKEALRMAIKKVKEGEAFTTAIDGPRGPIYKAKRGIVILSQEANIPILPVRAFPHSAITFEKSWHKDRLPKPFSRIDVVFGTREFHTQDSLEHQFSVIDDFIFNELKK